MANDIRYDIERELQKMQQAMQNNRNYGQFEMPKPTNKKEMMEQLGFILTKWYVNILLKENNTDRTQGFILTKWYVNKEKRLKKQIIVIEFHIN